MAVFHPRVALDLRVCLLFLFFLSSSVFAQTRLGLEPTVIQEGAPFKLLIHYQHNTSCGDRYALEAEVEGFYIDINISEVGNLNCITVAETKMSQTLEYTIENTPAGLYSISVFHPDGSLDQEFDLFVDRSNAGWGPTANHESPAAGQVVSGIGLIRGWGCRRWGTPGLVRYQIDDGEILPIPYGSSRRDTLSRCDMNKDVDGLELTGYGAVTNWNNYAPGKHRFRLWLGGVLEADHDFVVANYDNAFMKGLERTIVVKDFPELGDVTKLSWSEADQNFKIINID